MKLLKKDKQHLAIILLTLFISIVKVLLINYRVAFL